MTEQKAIEKIKKVKRNWKISMITIKNIKTWMIDNYYILVKFTYRDKENEYREDASTAWIENI